jgi:hypothetical protein
MAAATTTEQGSAKVTKGKQATAKVSRRSSSAQHNNQPTTKRGSAKVAREKQIEAKRKGSSAQRNNQPITEQGSANIASGMQVTVKLYTIFATITLLLLIVVTSATALGPLLPSS